jgi:lysophospholipase L1-like esterase
MKMARVRLQVLVIGDSHIRRLTEYIAAEGLSQNFGLDDVDISFESLSGGTIPQIEQEMGAWITRYQPHIIVIHVGGNDLCRAKLQAWSLGDQLITLAKRAIQEYGIKKVVLSMQFHRTKYPAILPTYTNKVVQFNKYIRVLSEEEDGIIYWCHRRTGAAVGVLLGDGVHLSKKGNHKFYKSLRSLFIHLVKQLSTQ